MAMEGNGSSPGVKREFCGDDQEDSSSKRLRGTGPLVDLRILLPSRTAGAIIGKGGANIKRLRQDYNAQVTVPDTTGPERVLNISAELGSAIEVIIQVLQGIEADRGGEGGTGGGDAQVRFLIHQSQAGAVIGKAGYKIKELREMCGAHIKVYTECCPQSTERIVEVGGAMDAISKTAYTVFEFLQTAPPKGISQPYNPDNFDEYFAIEYGGFTNMDTGLGTRGRGGRGGGPPGMFGRGFGLRGAPRGNRGGAFGGGFAGARGGGDARFGTGFDEFSMGLAGFGAASGGFGMPRGVRGGMRGGASSMGSASGGNLMDNNYQSAPAAMMGGGFDQDTLSAGNQGTMFGAQSSEYTQVSIPKDMAGAIIGKGGARIKQIRMESGATITIDEPQPGSNDRIINISGTADQIQNAQYLLQMSVKQFAGGQHF